MNYIKFKLNKNLGVSLGDRPERRSIAQSNIAREEAAESRRNSNRGTPRAQ